MSLAFYYWNNFGQILSDDEELMRETILQPSIGVYLILIFYCKSLSDISTPSPPPTPTHTQRLFVF